MKSLPLGLGARRAGAGAADRSAGHEPLWLEWAALLGLLAFASWLLGARGVWALLLRADPTGLTLVIVVVFAASTLWCGARARTLQRERDRLDRDPARHAPDGTRKAIDPRHDPDLGWAAEYRRMLHAAGGDAATALDLLLERTHGPHGTAWWVNGIQLKLGLLGKVIGFSILALEIGNLQSFDAAQSQDLLRSLTTGLGVALLTTMVGLVGNILLGLQLTRLDRYADRLVADIQRRLATDIEADARAGTARDLAPRDAIAHDGARRDAPRRDDGPPAAAHAAPEHAR